MEEIKSSKTRERVTGKHQTCVCAETPMLEDADEGGVRLWHLVKASEEPELPKHRRGSLRERERAKAIPEIYLTRLLSMKVQHTHLGLVPLSRDCRKEMRSTGVPHFLKINLFFKLHTAVLLICKLQRYKVKQTHTYILLARQEQSADTCTFLCSNVNFTVFVRGRCRSLWTIFSR